MVNSCTKEVKRGGKLIEGHYKGYCTFLKKWLEGDLYACPNGVNYIILPADIEENRRIHEPDNNRKAFRCDNVSLIK